MGGQCGDLNEENMKYLVPQMKQYNLITTQKSIEFDTLEELLENSSISSKFSEPDFYRLSIRNIYCMPYCGPNYNEYYLHAEYHEGYTYQILGRLKKNNCLIFNPTEELGIDSFNPYDWFVYRLIGRSAFTVMYMIEKGENVDMIKKFIESEMQYQEQNF